MAVADHLRRASRVEGPVEVEADAMASFVQKKANK